MVTRLASLPGQGHESVVTFADLGEPHTAVIHSFAEEVILRVARQARKDKVTALAVQVDLLCAALMGVDDDAAAAVVRDARLNGMSADSLYHGLVAGAVEKVGNAWEEQHIGMPDMLRASGRVWRILRDLREVFVQITDRKPGQHAVFASCPGETHRIGFAITADDLRRRGWEIEMITGLDHDALVAQIEGHTPLMVAIGATSAEMTLPLARLVAALRAHIPGIWVMIGGPIVHQQPDLLALTGADVVADSADEAEALMLGHISDLTRRRINRR